MLEFSSFQCEVYLMFYVNYRMLLFWSIESFLNHFQSIKCSCPMHETVNIRLLYFLLQANLSSAFRFTRGENRMAFLSVRKLNYHRVFFSYFLLASCSKGNTIVWDSHQHVSKNVHSHLPVPLCLHMNVEWYVFSVYYLV